MKMQLESFVSEVRPLNYNNLPPKEREYYDMLNYYQFPDLEEKMLDNVTFSSRKEFQVSFAEFKKYVALANLRQGSLAMIDSESIDPIWHQFMLFSSEYFEFCDKFYGGYLHHRPKRKGESPNREGAERFISLYRRTFGELHPIWKVDQPTSRGILAGCEGCNSECDIA